MRLIFSDQGQVKECPHCFGSGMCMDGNFLNVVYWACRKCIQNMRPDLDFQKNQFKVSCSICQGKGYVWLGRRDETILNNGVVITGGSLIAENIAVGQQSKVESQIFIEGKRGVRRRTRRAKGTTGS